MSHRLTKPALAGLALLVTLLIAAVVVLGGGEGDEVVADTTTSSTTEPSTTTTTTEQAPPTAPLTGEAVTDPGRQAKLLRPALVVKIDNADRTARPQFGLTRASVVYEPRVEGGVTRFLAVYHTGDADPVGPVRSFRTTDVHILSALNRPLFAWHGANRIALRSLKRAEAEGRVVDLGIDARPGAYDREPSRRAPHDSLTDTSALFVMAPDGSVPPPPLGEFLGAGEDPGGGEPARLVELHYGGGPGSVPIHWAWDAEREVWLRSQSGTPHVDASGEQVAVSNVIVQFTDYVDTGQVDSGGSPVPEARTVGDGEVWLFTRGQRFVGTWHKESSTATTRYLLPDGSPMQLSPGKTWVQLPPPGGAGFG